MKSTAGTTAATSHGMNARPSPRIVVTGGPGAGKTAVLEIARRELAHVEILPEAATIVRGILEPFKEDGVVGAVTTRSRRVGGSDNTSFNNAGMPGIGMGQDPIEYGSHTWHTNLDTYERILEDDVKKDAMVIAWSVYQLAMHDDLLPRFSKADMPAKPAPAETSSQPPPSTERTEAQAAKPPAKTKSRTHRSRHRGRR